MLTNEKIDIIIKGLYKNSDKSGTREDIRAILEKAKYKPLWYDSVGSMCPTCNCRIVINSYYCPFCGQRIRERLD